MTTAVEGFRGTNERRHPWFALADPPPPTLPPDCRVHYFGGEPGPDDCPRCGFSKVGECLCGYNWTTLEWTR